MSRHVERCPNTASSGRDQCGINLKDRARNGRAADAGVSSAQKLQGNKQKSSLRFVFVCAIIMS